MFTTQSATAEAASQNRSIADATDLLWRAAGLNELIYLASAALYRDDANRTEIGAIQMGAHILGEVLTDVQTIILAHLAAAQSPGPARPAQGRI